MRSCSNVKACITGSTPTRKGRPHEEDEHDAVVAGLVRGLGGGEAAGGYGQPLVEIGRVLAGGAGDSSCAPFSDRPGHPLDGNQTSHNQLRNQWVLRSMPLFDELEGIDMAFLASLLKTEEFKAGEVVIREGEEGDKFYIVETGELVVTHAVHGATTELSRRKAGDYVGEIALLEKRPRTATVTAATDTVLLSLAAEDFYNTLPNFLKMRETLESSSSRRLSHIQRAERSLGSTKNTVATESES